MRRARLAAGLALVTALGAAGCGGEERAVPAADPAGAGAAAPTASADPGHGLVLALAQFAEKDGKPVPGPARLEFLALRGGRWQMTALEDPESNVFHKALAYPAEAGPRLLSLGGTAAIVKLWEKTATGPVAAPIWRKDFGGKFSRMRDAEVADLYGDGRATIAVATHDPGRGGGAAARSPAAASRRSSSTISPTPSCTRSRSAISTATACSRSTRRPASRTGWTSGPSRATWCATCRRKGEGRTVVADLGERHAKEILVADVDGDGRDELYVSVEGEVGGEGGKQLVAPVEIRRYDAGTPADQGSVIATLDDRLCRFLTAGDLDGDGKRELIAATFSSGLWLLRPGADAEGRWQPELIDADSAGFEHAALIADLDGDGVAELYVASDQHKEVRRYVWKGGKPVREVIYRRARRPPDLHLEPDAGTGRADPRGLTADRSPERISGQSPSPDATLDAFVGRRRGMGGGEVKRSRDDPGPLARRHPGESSHVITKREGRAIRLRPSPAASPHSMLERRIRG